jgi:CBS domain-containing protein
MSEEDVGIVPVVDAQTNRLVGVVTDRDLCLDVVAAGRNPKETKIANSLHAQPVICFADDDIEECLEQMKLHQVRRVPIVDEDGRCVGIISQKDLALVLNEPQKLIETVKEISKSASTL